MKPYILERANWKTVKGEKYEVAVLPWGATEPHNYHLPYGTDSLETKSIAIGAAGKAWQQGAKVMVLPTIPLGVQNPGQIELPFCLHTRPSTQLLILKDIVDVLSVQGILKLIIMNGHGGNDFKPLIRELTPLYPKMFIGLVEWFRMLKSADYFEEEGDHAGEMETSIMQFYYPELVRPLEEAGGGKSKKFRLRSLNDKVAWVPRRWDKISDDTGVGYPGKSSPEKGGEFIGKVTDEIAGFLVELSNANPDDIYEK